jgi:hypothetical protein
MRYIVELRSRGWTFSIASGCKTQMSWENISSKRTRIHITSKKQKNSNEKVPELPPLVVSWSLENGGSVWTEGLQTCCPKRLNPQETKSPVSVAMVLWAYPRLA